MKRCARGSSLLFVAVLGWAAPAAADGLYLKLATEESRVQADQPVRFRLTAVATRSLPLPATPEFLIDDGKGSKPFTSTAVRAVEAAAPTVITPDAPLKSTWELQLPHPGRYQVRVRYQLRDRVIQSNKVSVEVLTAVQGTGQ